MSPTVRRLRYERARAQLPEKHPRVRALYGRWISTWCTPMRDLRSIEAIAWFRATGARPGYMNRHERRRIERHTRQVQLSLAI